VIPGAYHQAGAGQAEITPLIGTPLSGFIARENRPSTGIDTPLFVRALALENQNQVFLMLSYELLGIAKVLEEEILAGLENGLEAVFARERCVLTATHNHSGPPTGLLLGEAPPDPQYVEYLVAQSLSAARQALAALQPAQLFATERRLPALTYNRRAVLPDGRVSIAPVPDLPVMRRGPLDDRMTILLWCDLSGRSLAALVNFACHGVAVLSQNIGADIPGALATEIGARLGAPCLFLQGAAGDTNPTTVTADRAELEVWLAQALTHLGDLEESLRPAPSLPLAAACHPFSLEFAPLPSQETAERQAQEFRRIAAGDLTSSDLKAAIRTFKNTMNLPLDAALDPAKSHFVAQVLAEHATGVLAAAHQDAPLPMLATRICIWRLGELLLVFLPGEIFSSTGLKIRSLREDLVTLPVTYLAPLVGYIPDQEALALGGYEVDDAWRFYKQPAAFALDSEARLINEVAGLIQELGK